MVYLDSANIVWHCVPPNDWEAVGVISEGKFIQTKVLNSHEAKEVSSSLPSIISKEVEAIYYVAPKNNVDIRYACNSQIFFSPDDAISYKANLGRMFTVCKCLITNVQIIQSQSLAVLPVTTKKGIT